MKEITWTKWALLLAMAVFCAVSVAQEQEGKEKKEKEEEEAAKPPEGEEEAAKPPEGEEEAATIKPAEESGMTEAEIIKKAGAYSVQMRDLEQKVNQLKEKIFRSKARLSLLAEKILAGPAGAGARATIVYSDKMGSSFRLTKTVFILDGVPIYNKSDPGGMKKKKGLQIFSAPVVPGEHTLSVSVEYKGNGYGVFAYLSDYVFKVRSSHAFSVEEGKSKSLEVMMFERGNIATPLEERPAIKYVEQGSDLGQ